MTALGVGRKTCDRFESFWFRNFVLIYGFYEYGSRIMKLTTSHFHGKLVVDSIGTQYCCYFCSSYFDRRWRTRLRNARDGGLETEGLDRLHKDGWSDAKLRLHDMKGGRRIVCLQRAR